MGSGGVFSVKSLKTVFLALRTLHEFRARPSKSLWVMVADSPPPKIADWPRFLVWNVLSPLTGNSKGPPWPPALAQVVILCVM